MGLFMETFRTTSKWGIRGYLQLLMQPFAVQMVEKLLVTHISAVLVFLVA
jgi:hypothetical protein